MWLAAQEGAGSPRGENSHISSASGGSGPIYAPGGVGEVTMGRPPWSRGGPRITST